MDIRRCLWSEYVIEKLARKHHLSTDEVEEALAGRSRFRRLSRGRLKGEDLFVAYGQTEAGPYVTVFFIHKKAGDALIVSARDMDEKERSGYRRK